MKKTVIFFIIIFSLCLTSIAQTTFYRPFPEDTATWLSDQYANTCMGYCGSTCYEMNGDTIINGHSYNKIYTRNGQFYYIIPPPNSVIGTNFSACNYLGAIRQDTTNKKVYFIDNTMSTDSLLYDFNLTVGDTIQSWYNKRSIQWPLIVSGYDSVFIYNSYYKLYNFNGMQGNANHSLIEGIGWTGDLFGIDWSGDHDVALSCFNGEFLNGGNFIGWQAYENECNVLLSCNLTSNIVDPNAKMKFSIFPNPFSFQTTLHTTNFLINASLIIYNSTGQKIIQINNINKQTIIIKRGNLLSGIYLLQLIESNRIIFSYKLFVEN